VGAFATVTRTRGLDTPTRARIGQRQVEGQPGGGGEQVGMVGQTGGSSSMGITQNPPEQTVPEQSGPHCASVMHGERQMASTHRRPVEHCAFAMHWGTRRTSGRHTPSTQASAWFGQSLSLPQAGWQKPLMHVLPGEQSPR
jgi:hypothetical protein